MYLDRVMTRFASPARRIGFKYQFTDGQNSIMATASEFSRLKNLSLGSVVKLCRGFHRVIAGNWRVDGYVDGDQLIPVSFKGRPRRQFLFRKSNGHTISKVRSDMARFLGVDPAVVYRAVKKKNGRVGEWAVA